MPKYQPIDLIGGFYTDDALSWSVQDTVNWLPIAAEVNGTRTVTKLRSPPGLVTYSNLASGPVRGTHDVEGKLFAVGGGSLFQIAVGGASTNRGAIPGVGRVSMAHNQITFGNQLTIVNSDSSGYVWNTVTNTLTKITDPGFEGSVFVDFIDGYMVHTDPFGRWFFLSELADALNFNTFDRYVPEASPDGLVVARAFQGQIVAFNQTTIEFYSANTANPTPGDTFQNTKVVINKGCASRDSVARINNTLAWLAEDGAVYVLNGYREQKISTVPLEQAFAGLDWSQAFAEVWEDQGHSVYYLTFPDGRSWGYDFSSGLWSRRESYELNRWRMNTLTFWQGKWIVGDFQLGKLYELKWGVYHEDGNFLISERTSGYSHSNQNRVLCPYMELMFDTGVGAEDDALGLSGDLADGILGEIGTYQYLVTGGIGTVTVSIASGSLPPGAVMNSAGLVTFGYTTAGSYSWVVKAEDSFGQVVLLPDSAVISAAAMMATNLRHYTGPAASLTIAPANIPWVAGPVIDVVSLSPNGLYLIGADADAAVANRIQFLKYDGVTNSWNVLALPATLPSFGPWSASWHPSGDYVAIGVNATSDRVFVYRRTGDTFTKIADPVVRQANQSVWVKWSPDGTKLACSNGNTADSVWVYNFDAATGVLSGGKGGINSADQTATLAWVPNQNNRYLIRGNSTNMSLVDTTGSPNMTVVDSVTLSGAFSDATGGGWFADDTTLVTLGTAFLANGPVTVWTINPSAGVNAINFAAYPATITTIGPNKRCALKLDGPYFAIARDIAAQASPFVYLVTGTTLTPFAGIPTGATGTVTNVSWRGAH